MHRHDHNPTSWVPQLHMATSLAHLLETDATQRGHHVAA